MTKDQNIFWFDWLRKLNTNRLEHRRRLTDTFINTIILYNDGRIYFGCNYKDCSKTMTFAELESAGIGSDFNALAAPYEKEHASVGLIRLFRSRLLLRADWIGFLAAAPLL